jgi:hypothetical protein
MAGVATDSLALSDCRHTLPDARASKAAADIVFDVWRGCWRKERKEGYAEKQETLPPSTTSVEIV